VIQKLRSNFFSCFISVLAAFCCRCPCKDILSLYSCVGFFKYSIQDSETRPAVGSGKISSREVSYYGLFMFYSIFLT
jgi:hypothetical protein